jgi:bacterioferritin
LICFVKALQKSSGMLPGAQPSGPFPSPFSPGAPGQARRLLLLPPDGRNLARAHVSGEHSMDIQNRKSSAGDNYGIDVQAIRRKAREGIEDGAVTDSYRADRGTVLRLLNEALATEVVCVLRYKRHFFMARGMNAEPVAAEFAEHATQEQEHADWLAERIVQLGGEPDLNPDGIAGRSHSEYVEAHTLEEMIKENLIAERIAIDSYKQMVDYVGDKDPTTRRLLEQILAVEEEHADDLADFLTH